MNWSPSPIDVFITICISIWIINKLIKKKNVVRDKAYWDDPNPNNDKIFDMILHDKEFLIDLRNIVEDEGGIYDFIDNIKPKMKPGDDYDPDTIDSAGGYKGSMWKANVSGKRTHIIIDKMIAAPTVQKYIVKYKLSKGWERVFGDTMYFVLSDYGFKKRMIDLFKEAGEEINFIIRDMTEEEKLRYFNL